MEYINHMSGRLPCCTSARLIVSLISCLALSLISAASHTTVIYAAPAETPRLAVLDFRDAAKLPQFELSALADSVRGAALSAPFIVMTKENMTSLLPEGTTLSECVGECEVEVGRKIGADYLITGEVGVISGQLQLLLRLYETRGGSLKGQATLNAPDVGALQPKVRRAAMELLTKLSPSLSVSPQDSRTLLFVRVSPRRAEVKLDRFVIPTTMKRPVEGGFIIPIEPGRHTVSASARGYISRSVTLRVKRGQPVEAELKLKRLGKRERCYGDCEADVFIYTDPPGARIYLNGRDTGLKTERSSMDPQLGTAALRVPAGEHVISARKRPLEASRRIKVSRGGLYNGFRKRPLKLRRPRGSLVIKSDPPGAIVRLNGEVIGQTPLRKRGLLARPYWLELIAEGYQSREELITIKRGETLRQRWKLNSSGASFALRVSYRGEPVAQASVWLDDRKLGETDERGEWSTSEAEAGDHLLQIRHPLYEPLSESITLDAGRTTRRRARLRGAFGYITIDTSALDDDLKRWAERRGERAPRGQGDSPRDPSTQLSVIWGGVSLTPPYQKLRVSAGSRWLQIRPPRDAESVFSPSGKRHRVKVGETLTIRPTWKRYQAPLTLKSAEIKSQVFIDGERVGSTPHRTRVKTGAHTIKLVAAGHLPYQKQVWVTRDGHVEEVSFKQRTLLTLRCGPVRGALSVDGAEIGESQVTLDVSPGRHIVSCAARGATVSDALEVAPGERVERNLTISAELLGEAYQRRKMWRATGLVSAGIGAALSIIGAVTLLSALPEAQSQRDLTALRWVGEPDPTLRDVSAQRWGDLDAQAQNAHTLGWGLIGSGLSLASGGLSLWWLNHE